MDWWWRQELVDEGISTLIHLQNRIVSRTQLLAAHWSAAQIRRPLRRGQWQTVHPGVYATHTGPIGYEERLLAALLYAGPAAGWSHYTAAEQFGLIKIDPGRPVHLTIPAQASTGTSRHRDPPGSQMGRSAGRSRSAPKRTRPCGAGHRRDLGVARSGLGCHRRGVSERPRQSGDVLHALNDRGRLRHRRALLPILTDVAAGSHSPLELRYLHDVERRHRLPTGVRQRQVDNEFTDVAYPGLVVELDGRFHLTPHRRWRDLDRDNRATLCAEATLRYGWFDITNRPCAAAVQVLHVLRRTTPTLPATPCSPTCPVTP